MWKLLARWGRAGGAAVALVFSITAAALAVSAVLVPGQFLASTPATTAATEPALKGTVVYDTLLPFTINAYGGALVCTGQLQNRVVKETTTQQLDFYYRVRGTSGPGTIGAITVSSFKGATLRVAYRTDGLGTVAPAWAVRSPTPGAQIQFFLMSQNTPPLSCAQHEESRFIMIKTTATGFHNGGYTSLNAAPFEIGVNEVAVVQTVQP